MAQALEAKPAVGKQNSYIDLDNDDGYEKYRGNCGLIFTTTVASAGGYSKWWDLTFSNYKDNVYDSDKKITFGVTFGGLMRDRLKFPKLYSYDYDIILRIVRGEKRFIGGCLSSSEYVYNLYVKTSVESQNEVVSKFLKQFNIISSKTDASIYKDRRRSLSLGTGNSSTNAAAALVDRTAPAKKDDNDNNDNNNNSTEQKNNNNNNNESSVNSDNNNNKKKEDDSSKYEHRVCNAHNEATDNKVKKDGLSDMKKRIGNDLTLRIVFGIPDLSLGNLSSEDETDVIVSFVTDDIFRFQATYLKKSTFEGKDDLKKEIYEKLYKWPKSAKEIFGSNIPKQNTKGLLSVFTTVSSTKVDIAS